MGFPTTLRTWKRQHLKLLAHPIRSLFCRECPCSAAKVVVGPVLVPMLTPTLRR